MTNTTTIRFSLVCALLLGFGQGVAQHEPSDRVSFDRDIRPVLSNVCYRCHGPDGAMRKKDLRLDLQEGLFGTTKMGQGIVVPGNPADSELVYRITHDDPGERMPPEDSLHTLSEQDIEKITRWIEQGAEYESHWSFLPLERPDRPDVERSKWVENPIDRFVLRKLEAAGLQPSAEADPVTLVRRLYIDLTGLPPTPEDVHQFRREGYAKTVERLLASPHYGEHMAVGWLDLVRYGDSNGYHADRLRSVWPYRDYVINSFNTNKPFDEFTVEQLAGDLFEDATTEDLVASGYNRMNQITEEGGGQAKEYLAIYAADRVRTTSSVWLGATMGCAQCHDHKFDPISTKDFYSFAAFFADVEEEGIYTSRRSWEPFLVLASEDEKARERELRDTIEDLESRPEVSDDELAAKRVKWAQDSRLALTFSGGAGWVPVRPDIVRSSDGSTLELLPDSSLLSTGEDPDRDTYEIEIETDRQHITGILIEALAHESFEKGLTRGTDNFVVSELEVLVRGASDEDYASINLEAATTNIESEEPTVDHAIDGDFETGWVVEAGDRGAETAVLAVEFDEPLAGGPGTSLRVRLRHLSNEVGKLIGRLRISLTSENAIESDKEVGIPETIRTILAKDTNDRDEDEEALFRSYYRMVDPALSAVRNEIMSLKTALEVHVDAYATTLITQSVEPRTMRVLPRGNWMDDSGEVVLPAVPAFLNQNSKSEERATRMDLAQWMVSRDNPLTARVYVNRLWKAYFGTGLSKVLDDLGAQGEAPSHPELLDWLAVEFMDSGWDVKHMVRLITGSAAYRQASIASNSLREIDPYNRLYARQSRIRYSAETVRDTALAVSGLLVRDIGGRSVRPYQPAGYYAHMNFPKREYEVDSGEHLYRRGMYTHWQRTFLHPSMVAFDAPSREECIAERPVSNTPQQALVLLNDPIYGEAARVFSERIVREGGSDVDARLQWAMEQALSRRPSSDELKLLKGLHARHVHEFQRDPEAAQSAVAVGEWPVPDDLDPVVLAAWTSVSRVILNLAEVITRS